ncbi:amino acid permease [Patescibacteria group bacterium]|nr:amino acid permease [Patescibacteria group bacterium]
MPKSEPIPQPSLSRQLSLPLFTFYGLGAILGAGIYALVGKVAGEAGLFAPLSFIIAAVMAALTGFSYAELSSRYPKSGGEAIYVFNAFKIEWLSTMIGLMVVLAAIVSSSALMNAFVGYLEVFLPVIREIAIIVLSIIATGVAIWGIKESALAATLFTFIEIGGLLLILWVGRDALMSLPVRGPELIPPMDGGVWTSILLGAFIAFYACIGFEDMANVAEEVKDPHRNLPLGIMFAIIGSTLLYCLVSTVAVLSLPVDVLRASDAPLALVYEQNTGMKPVIITFIGLFAVANGILIQIVMGSRILLGLSRKDWLPNFLTYVSPVTRTPVTATVIIGFIILVLAIGFDLTRLAQFTSLLVLIIFAMVNLSCMRIKIIDPKPKGVTTYPFAFPLIGFILILSFVGFRVWMALG